jgi:hypothetical protein
VNNATVFTLGDDGRFRAIAALNEGSEIAALVLQLPPGQHRDTESHSGQTGSDYRK